MNIITEDDIDFSAYLDMTDHDHKVKSARDYVREVIDHFWSESEPKGATMNFVKTRNAMRFRPHEVSIWTGYSGHGKSLLLGQVVIGFAMQGLHTCIASMEMKPKTTLARMARQASGAAKPDVDFIDGFCDAIGDGLYIYDQQGMVQPDKMIAVIRYCAIEKKCSFFIIDSLLKCGIAEDDYNGQKRFVDQLCSVAKDTGIHIHLVAHARKGKDEMTPPDKHDVRGAASITDQVDNVLICFRNKAKEDAKASGKDVDADPDAYLICRKQRNGDWEGALKLYFDPASQQYTEVNGMPIDLLNTGMYA